MKLKKSQIIWGAVIAVIIAALVFIYFFGKNNGWFSIFESRERFQAFVDSFGVWAPLVFFALQFFQVILSPIPGNLTTLVGGMMFGFWQGFLISLAAVIAGSICAFILGKLFGRPLVERVVGKKVVEKYLNTVSSRQRMVLILMFLLPFFPDDVLCLIAGLTAMRVRSFTLIMILTRPWGLLASALLGAGMISISFTMPVWGWIIIGVVSAALFFLVFKYAPRIEERIHRWVEKISHKKNNAN